MIPALLAKFAFGRLLLKVPPWVWGVLAGVLLAFALYRVGVGAGKADKEAELAPKIAGLERDLAQARANNATLSDALAEQSAAVAAMGERAEAAKAAAREAEKRAAETRKRLSGVQSRLIAESRQTAAQRGREAIPLTEAQREAWEMMR